ncbi:MAG: hypothetical protein J7J65_04265 [Candidatus Korarchaeota archaeon]|nr:hypothetical protein [Candidatus Korarchaeota archaeon]
MIALLEDLRTRKEWRALVRAFIEELSSLPVRQVIALPSPDDKVYDSNVLVVLEEDTPEDTMEVVKAAVRAERRMGVEGILSPLAVGAWDSDAVRRFMAKAEKGRETA